MKLGCLLKSILGIIILVGVSHYIYTKYGDRILDIGEERISQFVEEEVADQLSQLKDSEYLDSLKVEIKDYFAEKDFSEIKETLPEILMNLKESLKDNYIDSLDFEKLKDNFLRNGE